MLRIAEAIDGYCTSNCMGPFSPSPSRSLLCLHPYTPLSFCSLSLSLSRDRAQHSTQRQRSAHSIQHAQHKQHCLHNAGSTHRLTTQTYTHAQHGHNARTHIHTDHTSGIHTARTRTHRHAYTQTPHACTSAHSLTHTHVFSRDLDTQKSSIIQMTGNVT